MLRRLAAPVDTGARDDALDVVRRQILHGLYERKVPTIDEMTDLPADLRDGLAPFLGELPRIVGTEPFYVFPAAVLVMAFMSFFIGTFLQLMWEDIPITEPL